MTRGRSQTPVQFKTVRNFGIKRKYFWFNFLAEGQSKVPSSLIPCEVNYFSFQLFYLIIFTLPQLRFCCWMERCCGMRSPVIGQFVFIVCYFMRQVGGYPLQFTSLFMPNSTTGQVRGNFRHQQLWYLLIIYYFRNLAWGDFFYRFILSIFISNNLKWSRYNFILFCLSTFIL